MDEPFDRDRFGVVSGALLLAMALARLLDVSGRPLEVMALGSPLGITLSETTLMLLIIAGLAVTGVESLVRTHPRARRGELDRSLMFWIVPALLCVGLVAWLNGVEDLGLWTLGLLVATFLVPLALLAEYMAVSPDVRRSGWLIWGQMLLVHLVALLLFTTIYGARLRGLLAGPAVLLATTLLAARLFWIVCSNVRLAFLYGAVAGLVLGQLVWVLNYWRLSSQRGGLLLLLFFYVVVGLLQQFLHGRFGRRVVLEYGGIALLVLAAIFLMA